jgi:hypothetical protein
MVERRSAPVVAERTPTIRQVNHARDIFQLETMLRKHSPNPAFCAWRAENRPGGCRSLGARVQTLG